MKRMLCMFRRRTKDEEQTRAKWFALCPSAIVLIPALLLSLIAAPLMRGQSVGQPLFMAASLTFVTTMLAALAVAWVSWRLCRRSDGIANVAVACVVLAGGFWCAGLNQPQRDQFEDSARKAVGRHVNSGKDLLRLAGG